ncbi:hypothetical protein [Lacrimispora xylanisolvens]|uniref:hypothetical protein n=1 Tax=Lacrimispora xylanisolvens TaxID=384636 RepID=UPI002402ABB1
MILKSAYAIDVSDGILQLEEKDSLWEALRIPLKEPMILAFTGGGWEDYLHVLPGR